MMKIQSKFLLLIALASVVAFVGCSEDETTGPAPPSDVEGYIAEGWANFSSGNGSDALNSFELAINLANEAWYEAYGDWIEAQAQGDTAAMIEADERMLAASVHIVAACSGFGWVGAKYPQYAAIGALTFDTGIALAQDLESIGIPDSAEVHRLHAELLAGYACLTQILQQWQQSNERIEELLAMDPDWDFDHDNTTNYLDLRLMSAENYYFLADFPASLSVALELNALLGFNSGLDETDFNLATIQGRTMLIELIEDLDELI